MFDKNEYLEEIELSNSNASNKRRQQILEILYAVSDYKIKNIDKKVVDKIINNSQKNIDELFDSELEKDELYKQLVHSLEVCLRYWDDGYFDSSKKHFKRFIKIKLNIKSTT